MESLKVGLTGAAGYVGSRVMADLLKRGHEVIALDNFYLGRIKSIMGTDIINADIRSEKNISVLSECDIILHLAAVSGLEDCNKDPLKAYEVNVIGLCNVVEICRKNSTPLVFPSSMAVFGNPKSFPIKENDQRFPLNLYGKTKQIGEEIILMNSSKFPSFIFIKSNIYGTHIIEGDEVTKKTVINLFVDKVKRGEKITTYKPGTQARNFIHVKDVSRAYVMAAEKNVIFGTEFLNIASEEFISMIQLANIIKNIATENGIDAETELLENPRKDETLCEHFDVDIERAKSLLGFNPEISLRQGIIEMF